MKLINIFVLFFFLLSGWNAKAQKTCYDWSKSWHFRAVEFNCTCGADATCKMDSVLLRRLDIAREISAVPFYITSGYRTAAHNIEVGGAVLSSHVDGKAADILTPDVHTKAIVLDALIRAGFERIGIYKRHIHVDCADRPAAFWLQ